MLLICTSIRRVIPKMLEFEIFPRNLHIATCVMYVVIVGLFNAGKKNTARLCHISSLAWQIVLLLLGSPSPQITPFFI